MDHRTDVAPAASLRRVGASVAVDAAVQRPRFGMGFRSRWAAEVDARPGAVDWFEVISDGYIDTGGARRRMLERLRRDHPIVMHGLSLSIAGDSPLPGAYLAGLRRLVDWVEPLHVSDHLCWTALGDHESHDLLPIVCTQEVLAHVAERVDRTQAYLGRRLVLENPTSYVAFRGDEMDEAEFFAALHRRTGCGMLLDVNNLQVNAVNLGIDPARYLETLPADMVVYLHLAGHALLPDVCIDTHDAAVPDSVWTLYDAAVARFPHAGVIVERDDDVPSFATLLDEVGLARTRHALAAASRGTGSSHSGGHSAPIRPRRDSTPSSADSPAGRWSDVRRAFFSQVVLDPPDHDQARDPGFGDLLSANAPVAAARGLRVYRDAYGETLRRALAANFPTLARVLSAADFAGLASGYLRAHPPAGFDFRRLGAALSAHLEQYGVAGEYGVPPSVLADIAAFEQAQLEVASEIEERPRVLVSSLADVASDRWADVRVRFSRAIRIVHCRFAVEAAVDAVARGEVPSRPEPRSVIYLLGRCGDEQVTLSLTGHEAIIFDRLNAGLPLWRAVETQPDGTNVPALALETVMRLLVSVCARGLLVGIDVATS